MLRQLREAAQNMSAMALQPSVFHNHVRAACARERKIRSARGKRQRLSLYRKLLLLAHRGAVDPGGERSSTGQGVAGGRPSEREARAPNPPQSGLTLSIPPLILSLTARFVPRETDLAPSRKNPRNALWKDGETPRIASIRIRYPRSVPYIAPEAANQS